MPDEQLLQRLTKRENEILTLLAEGFSNRYIAEQLGLTVRTVKFHTCNIYLRLGVKTRAAAIAWIWRHRELQNSADD